MRPRGRSGTLGGVAMRVGTSGWVYAEWRGDFYPEGLPQRRWLEHYASVFDTVEVNNAFYRLPERETFENWRSTLPDGFCVAVKASRYLTHIKRLREPAEPVARLMSVATGLGDKLGPVLLQLPPTLKADPALLDACLAEFPAGVRVAVEPRHDTWWTDDVRLVLERHTAALAWADRGSKPMTPLWRTAGWGYLRLHEGGATPWPSYGRTALTTWAERLAGFDEAYAYFNNDQRGAAPRDAAALVRLSRPGRGAPR
jgi:uncharacterized protein YecE (DUF72 family)